MKSFSDLLHRTPWWALLIGGLAVFLALGAFVTPYHIIDYRRDAATPEAKRQIKREIDNAFADNAIDIASNVIRSMRGATSDAARREELTTALEQLEDARRELRDAGSEVLRAKRQAAENVAEAVREASRAVEEAQKEAARALQDAGVKGDPALEKSLNESLDAARGAEREAKAAVKRAEAEAKATVKEAQAEGDAAVKVAEAEAKAAALRAREEAKAALRKAETLGPGIVVLPPVGPSAPVGPVAPVGPAASADPVPPTPPSVPEGGLGVIKKDGRIVIQYPGGSGKPGAIIDIDTTDADKSGLPPPPPLPPELRSQIRHDVTRDLYRIGLGAAILLLLVPVFIVTLIAKFFIDRSRAAQRMAELKRKEAEYAQMSRQVTEAKLSALQAQVEPHFLYNTLASVQALTEVDPQQANAMTGHLIQYLRNALPKMRDSVSTVGQEVELVRAYLNILQMRMGKRLTFAIEVPPELNDAPFPPLMLPSLVENAIKHGLEPLREGGEVRIGASEENGRLRLVVSDTGRGFSETTSGTGVGLTNIRERLAALYGAEAVLTLEALEPRGVAATIEVPRHRPAQAPIGAPPAPPPAAAPEAPTSAARRTLATVGKAERVWRKTLSFAFVGLVIVAAVMCGLALVGVTTGMIPVRIGDETVVGPSATLLGTAGVAIVFALAVLAIGIVIAVIYGLGFLFAGLAIFIPLVVLVSLVPALSPFILLGLAIWWLVRRSRRKRAAGDTSGTRIEPTVEAAAARETPPVPGAQ